MIRRTLSFVLGTLVLLWCAYTLSEVALYGGAVLFDPDTTSRIMAVRVDGVVYSAAGLTYNGLAGALLVVIEVAGIFAALWYGLRSSGSRKRIASIVLVLWVALWMGNAIWLKSLGWNHPVSFATIAVAMLVTLGWAALCLTEPDRSIGAAKEH